MNNEGISGLLRSKLTWLVIGTVFVLLVLNPVTCVDAGSKGLRFTMGALDDAELEEGINFKLPGFQSIRQVSTRTQEVTFTIEVGQSAAITKDNQSIGATLTLFFRYKSGELVRMWRNIGEEQMLNIIVKTATENYKKTVGQYTIFDIPYNQEKLRSLVFETTKANLTDYPIDLTELKITNYDWSEQFDRQIEETMQRAQEVKRKEQELLIAEQEAQKQVKQAEAAKTSMITQAQGEKESARLRAEAKVLEGEGIRKYNESIAANQALELQFRRLDIEKARVEKWNGQYVPNNHYGPIPVSTGNLQPNNK